MRAKKANSLLISTADYQQLIKLIERYDTPAADALDE